MRVARQHLARGVASNIHDCLVPGTALGQPNSFGIDGKFRRILHLGIQPQLQHTSVVPKTLTRDQLQSRKDKAVRFVRNVLHDPDRAEEIEDESLESYGARRKIELINPRRGNRSMATKTELENWIADLEERNQQLRDQLDAISDIVGGEEEDTLDTDDDDEEGE